MNIPYTHESIRLTGRWDVSDPRVATATATGSYLEFAFEGRMARLYLGQRRYMPRHSLV